MTISSTTRIAGPFTGNGTASAFPFTFKVFAATDLDVIKLTVSTGTESTLVLTTDYTVTLNGDQNSNPGGTVTLTAGALASGFTLTITSDIANLQPTDLTNQGGFYPEVITDSLDRATIQIQQIADIGDRTLKIPISDGSGLDMQLPTATQRANAFLAFDASGEPTAVTAGSGGAPATITRQVFSGTGSQTVFTLASDPGALGNSAQVYIGGIYQQRSTYTIGGTTLTFSQAPVAGTDNIEFVNFLTDAIGSTSADLVTYTPSGSGAVARSAASKFADVVSVKDFGAVGNGVTDDTTAFNNAWTASNPNPVYVPGGSYAITGTVTGSFVSFGAVTIVGGTVNSISQYAVNATISGNATVTGDLAVNGGDITTTSATANLVNATATVVNIGGAATTVALGAAAATVSIGNLSMNSGYGSIAPVYGCRGWVTWNGATTTTTCPWGGGGTATVERASGSSTATITTSANHNMLSGHRVYATAGIATDSYTITVTAPNQFTVTTVATTLIAAGTPITLQWYTIQASGNVHSVSDDTYVGRAYVNWATAFPDANYSVHVTSTRAGSNIVPLIAGTIGADPPTATACPVIVMEYTSSATTGGFTSVTAFR